MTKYPIEYQDILDCTTIYKSNLFYNNQSIYYIKYNTFYWIINYNIVKTIIGEKNLPEN